MGGGEEEREGGTYVGVDPGRKVGKWRGVEGGRE